MKVKGLLLLLALTIGVAAQSAQAQVSIEGTYSYSTKLRGSRLNTSAIVSRITNYNFQSVPTTVILTLATRKFNGAGTITGITMARRNLGNMPARVYYSQVGLSGVATAPRSGRFFPTLLLVNPITRGIYDFGNFSKYLIFSTFRSGQHATGLKLGGQNLKINGDAIGTYNEIR